MWCVLREVPFIDIHAYDINISGSHSFFLGLSLLSTLVRLEDQCCIWSQSGTHVHSVGVRACVRVSRLSDLYHKKKQHWQDSESHVPGVIRTRNPSKRVAADLRLRPRGHQDWHSHIPGQNNSVVFKVIFLKKYHKCREYRICLRQVNVGDERFLSEIFAISDVCWTVHHCHNWRIITN